ncbi:F-box protein At4g18380-like [Phalaenopsis equestris]|uniref:F-box protein At4g18380-like n=1 Tax=Phalaenopsis equestris TaxID=78828 RepID=UPI0009E59BAA|nr:F-box protein At4g18380-like [Phalaenopsis equestris]XP_020583097.1 F-box protein At4g18380-like [Phalaenopsis equestris]
MQSKSRIHADSPLQEDQFDRIPDPLILQILNYVADIRALGRCAAVSKRFNSLVPLVHDVYVKIDRVVTVDGDTSDDSLNLSSSKPRNLFSHLLKILLLTFLKPFHNLQNSGSSNKPLLPQLSHHSPAQVLKNFAHVRNLRIELPAGDVGTEDGVVLKWRAEFGSTLENCVILGGTRIERKLNLSDQDSSSSAEDNGSIPESFYTNGGLKLRVVWTISSLIAASTRHYLLKPIIKDHPTLRSLVLTDADGQGTLIMGEEQLRDFREKPLAASASANRTQVPASNMKLRYAPYLELPEGMGMQGATLVAIRPSNDGCAATVGSTGCGGGCHGSTRKEIEAFVSGAFDGPFRAAVKALLKRRTYLLEMNGF